MITQQQLDDARNEMIFREEQLHQPDWPHSRARLVRTYNAARESYLTLLMEYRLSQLQEVQA